jgi:hypothetical protein
MKKFENIVGECTPQDQRGAHQGSQFRLKFREKNRKYSLIAGERKKHNFGTKILDKFEFIHIIYLEQ